MNTKHLTAGRRLLATSALAATLVVGAGIPSAIAAPSAQAAKGGCPASPSTWHLTTREEWVERTVAGFLGTFESVDEAAFYLLGPEKIAADLMLLVNNNFDLINVNGDDHICTTFGNPAGIPDWYFNVSDNKFNSNIKK